MKQKNSMNGSIDRPTSQQVNGYTYNSVLESECDTPYNNESTFPQHIRAKSQQGNRKKIKSGESSLAPHLTN